MQESSQFKTGAASVERKLNRDFGFRYDLKAKVLTLFWSCRNVRYAFLAGGRTAEYKWSKGDPLFEPLSASVQLAKPQSPTKRDRRPINLPTTEQFDSFCAALKGATANLCSTIEEIDASFSKRHAEATGTSAPSAKSNPTHKEAPSEASAEELGSI